MDCIYEYKSKLWSWMLVLRMSSLNETLKIEERSCRLHDLIQTLNLPVSLSEYEVRKKVLELPKSNFLEIFLSPRSVKTSPTLRMVLDQAEQYKNFACKCSFTAMRPSMQGKKVFSCHIRSLSHSPKRLNHCRKNRRKKLYLQIRILT